MKIRVYNYENYTDEEVKEYGHTRDEYTEFTLIRGNKNEPDEGIENFIKAIDGKSGMLLTNNDLAYGCCYGRGEPYYIVNRELNEMEKKDDTGFCYKVLTLDEVRERLRGGGEYYENVEAVFIRDEDEYEIAYTNRNDVDISGWFEWCGDLFGWAK